MYLAVKWQHHNTHELIANFDRLSSEEAQGFILIKFSVWTLISSRGDMKIQSQKAGDVTFNCQINVVMQKWKYSAASRNKRRNWYFLQHGTVKYVQFSHYDSFICNHELFGRHLVYCKTDFTKNSVLYHCSFLFKEDHLIIFIISWFMWTFNTPTWLYVCHCGNVRGKRSTSNPSHTAPSEPGSPTIPKKKEIAHWYCALGYTKLIKVNGTNSFSNTHIYSLVCYEPLFSLAVF